MGTDKIEATSTGRIGLQNGFGPLSGIEEIVGVTDSYIAGDNSDDTLDFSQTTLTNISSIQGGGGYDNITGSSADDVIIGGTANDTLKGGGGNDTYRVAGNVDGYDRYQDTGTLGTDKIEATSTGRIGLQNGFGPLSGIEEIVGVTDSYIAGDNSDDTLDFSTTTLTKITKVDASNGYDTVRTALTSADTDGMLYDGGSATDRLQITLTLAQAQNSLILTNIGNYLTHIASTPSVSYNFNTLGYSAVNFENAEAVVQIGMFQVAFDKVILGTGGNDKITPTFVSSGVTGNPPPTNARDLILGNNYNDTIDGGGGNDILIGGHGEDSLNGGTGNDFFVYDGTNNGLDIVDGGIGSDQIIAANSNTIIGLASGFDNGVEVIDATGKSSVKVIGSGGNDILNFSGVQFKGTFEIDGGNYNDTITTSNVSAGRYRGSHGNDTFVLGTQDTTLLYIGNNNGLDSFIGNNSATHTIRAEANNTIIGLANGFNNGVGVIDVIDANDKNHVKVQGNGGDDTLNFSSVQFNNVNDTFEIDGGNYNDTITTSNVSAGRYRGSHGNDTFVLGTQDTTLLYIGNNNGLDSFIGNNNSATHTILAQADNTIIGLANGFDNGVDVIDATDKNGVNKNGVKVQGNGGNDILNFSSVQILGNVTIDGGNYNDNITGSSGNDVILGSHGNDTLTGGDGNDTLTGGIGNDTFVFASGFASDTITDFKVSGTDKIDVSTFGFTGITDTSLTITYGANPSDNDIITSTKSGFGQITLAGFTGTLIASDFIFV